MQRYKDWAPGPGDIKGKGIHHLDNPYMFNEWLVAPLIRTRDCGHLSQSNWDYVIKLLEGPEDEDYDDYEVMSWNHWACGWFDMIVVKQGTRAHVLMNKVETSLESYPALDEDDWMQRESDDHHDQIMEACFEAIDYAKSEEDVREHFDIASEDSFNIVLRSGFSPFELADHLNWEYGGLTPTNENIYEALLEIGGLEVDYV